MSKAKYRTLKFTVLIDDESGRVSPKALALAIHRAIENAKLNDMNGPLTNKSLTQVQVTAQ